MFGSYPVGTPLTFGNITITTSKNEMNTYCRTPGAVQKIILSDFLLFHPVEPVTQPKEITHYLLIELKTPLHIPKRTLTIYVTFPVEIGVYIPEQHKEIDIFTLTNPKYTLYGPLERGFICKWWQSEVHTTIPEVDPLTEGVMKVTINNTNTWATLNKIVFDAHHMKIYYKEFACMNAVIEIESNIAVTSFVEKPLKEDMTPAVELYKARKIPLLEHELRMEWGL